MEPYTLVTSIGIGIKDGKYPVATYCLNNATEKTPYCSVALIRLLEAQPKRIVVMLTSKAHEITWPAFRKALVEAGGVEPEECLIPDANTEEEVSNIFSILLDKVSDDSSLVLDVTLGLRSLPFVYFTTIGFLRSLKGARLGGVYYGAFDNKLPDNTVPIVELTSLATLVDWSYAVQSFRETGYLGAVSNMLDERVNELLAGRDGIEKRGFSFLRKFGEAITQLVAPLASSLSLETGLAAKEVLSKLEKLDEDDETLIGPGRYLLENLEDQLRAFAIAQPQAMYKVKNKQDIPLTWDELRREKALIEFYLRHEDLQNALFMLREWMVNRTLLASGVTRDWLSNNPHRSNAERQLGSLARGVGNKTLSPEQIQVGQAWQQVAINWRNQFAHGGFKLDNLKVTKGDINACLERIEPIVGLDNAWLFNSNNSGSERAYVEGKAGLNKSSSPGQYGDVILVTGLGLSPGVLYSGIINLRPDRAVILTSPIGTKAIGTALEHAGYPDLPKKVFELQDPFADFAGARALVRDACAQLTGAKEVICNLTGGTTALQWAVQCFGQEAVELGLPVRYVALVDRRSIEEQRRNPWVLGELIDVAEEAEVR